MSAAQSVRKEMLIKGKPGCIYKVLLDSKHFAEMAGGAPAEINPELGGAFTLFGGMISGRNVELIDGSRIVQAWRPGNWEAGRYSIVKFELTAQGEQTRLVVEQTGYPEEHRAHLESGWVEHYLQPLRDYFAKACSEDS